MTTLSQLTYGWSGATIIGTAGIAGMVIGGLICWAYDRLSQRMQQIRHQRRTLASIRPRRTAELELTHSRGIAR